MSQREAKQVSVKIKNASGADSGQVQVDESKRGCAGRVPGSDAAASAEGSRRPAEPAPVAASLIVPSASRAAETASVVYSCVCGRSSATKAPAAGSS